MKNRIFLLSLLIISGLFNARAQVLEPVKWSFSINRLDEKTVEVIADATIDDTWHLYSTQIPEGGPIATSLFLEESELYAPVGDLKQSPEPKPSFDAAFQMELGYFSKQARITQVVEIKSNEPLTISGYIEFMACDDHRCLPPIQVDFSIEVPVEFSILENVSPMSEEILEAIENASAVNYWGIFWLAFFGGLTALLTPCVFPMIPLTVSFFLRNADNKAKAIRDGFFYGITIILAYVILGLAISLIFGSDALNRLATSPVFNILFFALLVFFAASFFGAFELILPSKWSNALDSKADRTGGVIGAMLMGLTFVIVSFSCTGPIVGYLLVEAVTGELLSPAIGMLGFSVALAIPFTFFAIFPAAMNSLPKSGGWMNAVKVVLGFIVLAFSLKFLSAADAVTQWGILDREVFIVLWIAIFLLMGLYLIGKIKFAHDSDLPYLSVPRLILSIATFAFVFYLIPGLWGAPLKTVSSFLPSITTQDFNINRYSAPTVTEGGNTELPPSSNIKEGPYGLAKYLDYEEGLEAARKAGKPVFLDFTGHACSNCKTMESRVWSDNTVRSLLSNEFIIISLYVDERQSLPTDQQYVSETTGRRIRNVGNKWSDFQITHYQTNTQPYYVLLDHNEQPLIDARGYNTDVQAFVEWMNNGITKFKE